MYSEKHIKEKGEELAEIAVENKLGSKQLTTIYRLVKTRPIPFVQAFIQRQIGRGIDGFSAVGPWLLGLLNECWDNPSVFERVLMYGIMLYDYYEKLPLLQHLEKIEPVVRQITERYGFKDVEVSTERGYLDLVVRLANFRGNPRVLSSMIYESIRRNVPEAANVRFRVWIESNQRR